MNWSSPAAIIEEANEAVPMPQPITNDLGGIGAARQPRQLMSTPR